MIDLMKDPDYMVIGPKVKELFEGLWGEREIQCMEWGCCPGGKCKNWCDGCGMGMLILLCSVMDINILDVL